MHSRVLAVLLLTAMLLFFIPSALANSWGLTGPLYTAVSSDHAWTDYTTLFPQQGDLALLGSRDHNALFYIDPAGQLQVCHTAVWQPQDHIQQSLQRIENGFVLTAGEEAFTFRLTDGHYCLTEARLRGVTVSPAFDDAAPGSILGYWYNDGLRCASFLSAPLSLADFNLRLFPRTIDEVLSVDLLSAALKSGAHCLSFREDW